MNAVRRIASRLPVALVAIGLVLILGCGDDTGLPKRYSVSGQVTYNNQPLPKGTITFTPVDSEGHAAAGTIQDGQYHLTTATPDDGAVPGKYRIKIKALEVDNSQVVANAGGGSGRQTDVLKAAKAAKRLIPARYELEDTSELTAEVKAESNTINFPLTD